MASVDAPNGSVWIINPDELAKRISDQESRSLPEANIAAVERIERWLYASVEVHQTIGVETVLSTDKYRRLVDHARRFGFQVNLIYVFLESADLNVERVATRVRKGGHAVPEEKVRSRRVRSIQQLSWFFAAADRAEVYDNSGARPQLVLSKNEQNEIRVHDDLIPEISDALKAAYPGVPPIWEDES